MPLEATVIVIDNSEYMRNGDYLPTRFEAQSDAVTVLFGHKVDSNPENTVGVMSMAGKGPEVLVTHTREVGKLLGALHDARQRLGGSSDVSTAIAVAQLALKHRANKTLRQRIVVFVGSPLAADEKALVKLAKKLKKNNVAVDVVSFGEESDNADRLRAFVDNVNSGENSHLVTVSPGPRLISDAVLASPILAGDSGIPDAAMDVEGPGGPGGGADNEFGIDPSLDPELAMALRLSLEEARQRQAAEEASASSSGAGPSTSAPAAEPELVPADEADDDDEALLQQAIAMSTAAAAGSGDVEMGEDDAAGDEEMSEEDEIQRAIEMSMKPPEGGK
ncbi:hypothetical protein EXIGLDRAFT_622763 [Exidia glandulosa HHB12029]|uniref:VWFA domain-containing protein n=1 Tax=Exidia glandulosa HHB12029 TaxID=1314781 RepID=A0A165DYS4_EXIGL|nr:hypothetical protein EXIGLDRAFT_741702 [Exidia glandulosa HHB12029]KZV85684.1 hypothetical protein EXIGLDRAFT_622763 [Exidia glandulosa HHB12029]